MATPRRARQPARRASNAGVSGISTRQVAKQYGQARASGLRGREAESAAFSSGAGSGG